MINSDHTIVNGDVIEFLPYMDNNTVDLIVTSPPYWQIKDYDENKQIGKDQDYEDYLKDLEVIFDGCERVLKNGCRMAINIGDQYLRASEYGRYHVKPIPADINRICRDIGFDFMGQVIWKKITNTSTSGGGSWMGSTYYPKDGHVTYEHEYILLFRKRGDWKMPDDSVKEKSRLTKEQRSDWFRGHWELTPARQKDHPAQFPIELPNRLIKMYSFWGETVFDPFLGSGTTTLSSIENERKSIGVELNLDYVDNLESKIQDQDYQILTEGDF